jgi:hypothetical protein
MVRYTLDTNCIIAMEESRLEASALMTLVERLRLGTVIVQITAIAAAERQRSGISLERFDDFRARIAALGLGEAVFLRPPMYAGLCFADYRIVHEDEFLSQERAIHEVIFSSTPFEIDGSEHPVGSKQWLRWLNAKCDVLTMWCHLHYRGGVLVSSDENFHAGSKHLRLLSMGAGSIVRPNEIGRAELA